MGKSLRSIFSEKIQVRTFIARFLSPERVVISGFAAVILLGALILWLPFAVSEARLSFVDALLTSTSAVCVTGLATIDLGRDLSMAGQIVTIFLFQIGGLGI